MVLIQPDLGTATILLIITSTLVFFSGIHFRWIIMGFVGLIFSIPAIWIYILKDYQKNRILILLDPQRDPLGAGYHIIQSKIAIGSGKFLNRLNSISYPLAIQTLFFLSSVKNGDF